MHGPDHQRVGVLAAQQPHGGDVVHRHRPTVLPRDDVVGHDLLGRALLQLVDRRHAQQIERRAVGVNEVIGLVADRHRVGERADDRVEPPLGGAKRHPQFADQAVVLALARPAGRDVAGERVKGPFSAVVVRRDRHLDGELGSVGPQRGHLHAVVQQRALACGQESLKALRVLGTLTLGDDQLGQGTANGGLPRDAERRLGGGVPVSHQASLIHRNDHAESSVEDALGERCAHRQRIIRIPADHRQPRPALTIPGATCGLPPPACAHPLRW